MPIVAAALLALLPQGLPAAPPRDSVLTAVAVRAERPPRIDGRDDDPVWKTAPAFSGFRQFVPSEDIPSRFRTEFKIAYDDRNFYVFIRAFDPHPDSIMHALSRHDIRGPSDQLKIIIDSYHDRRTGFEFAVNPDGVKREYSISADVNEDDSWNGVWDVATAIDSLGWTAEFSVPFSQLRYADAPAHVFGFGIWRDLERFKERDSWPVYRESKSGFMSQLGDVEGINGIPASHTLEVTPYVVARNLSRATTSAFTRVQQEAVGGDIKYGLTPNLTLDATVNPDFGQVEADPAVLNLTAFETFFPEKRPFFIEGSGIYQVGLNCTIVNCNGEGLFYSRRIGRSPQLLGTYGDASSPTSTPIAAAAKLTGRLANGLSIGVMDASTPAVFGPNHETIEPGSNYAVVRLQQDLRNGQSGFGAIATAVDRSLDSWTSSSLRRSAYVGGGDFRHKFGSGQYEVSGSMTASEIKGSAASIAASQLDAVHYYQRPDGALHFDSTRTSLSGDAEDIRIGKYGGGVTQFQTSYQRQSAGFEPNDLGFLLRADQQNWSTWGALLFRKPTRFYKLLQLNVNQWNSWTAAGLRLEDAFNTNGHVNLPNNWWVHVGGTLNQLGEVYCDRCARGGPALRVSPNFSPWIGFAGDDRNPVVPSLFFNFGRWDEGRSWYVNVNPAASIKFSTALQTSLGASITRGTNDQQWYGTFTDSAHVTHYTFARLDQFTLSLTARATYTVSPTLTIEFYGQPFVASGSYLNVRQLSATPRASAYDARFAPFTPASGSSNGFADRELRSNTVIRWEYQPGSTLFVVWTQGRQAFDGSFTQESWTGRYRDLFALHPDNTFLVKLAYWLNR